MQNFLQKFRRSSLVFVKPGILSKNLKTFTRSNYHIFQYFLLKLHTRYLLTNVYKRVFGIFLFCLDLELIGNIKNTWFLHTHFFIFIDNSRSEQNKKILEHPFVEISKQGTCARFQQKILNFMLIGACQNLQFFKQTTCVLGNNRDLFKFRYQV